MPWKDKTVEELRKEFVLAAKESENFSSLCREFGISRTTGYKWLERDSQGEDLCDRSHVPQTIPGKTASDMEAQILQLRAENPGWGGRTIRRVLENRGVEGLPCVKTVNNILKRNGCIEKAESEKRERIQRFQREHCNELWQCDFKGDFPLLDGSRCYPLDILDDCSRYCLCIEPKPNTLGTMTTFDRVFREYGLPKSILTDNGAQFAGFNGGYTKFERWLMDLDVAPIHGRVMHPQTQGKIERFHRTMKNEILDRLEFSDLKAVVEALEPWRIKYNTIRPHEALDMKCPAEVYRLSEREYTGAISTYEYEGIYRVIKVNNWGYLRFDQIEVYLSETMANTYLEIRAAEGDKFQVFYRNYRIAEIDAVEKKLLNRKIVRLP